MRIVGTLALASMLTLLGSTSTAHADASSPFDVADPTVGRLDPALLSAVQRATSAAASAPTAAPLLLIVTQAGRLAQSALSLELTAAEQCRVLNGSAAALLQLEQSARSGEQAASRLRKLARGLLGLLEESPGRRGKRSPASGPLDGSDFEIAPLRT